jgi:hypothetical protein
MPYKSKQEGGVDKGKPSEGGKSKAEVKRVDKDELERTEEMRKKYADEDENPDPDKVNISHKNRNRNKPDIDKPAYGNSK